MNEFLAAAEALKRTPAKVIYTHTDTPTDTITGPLDPHLDKLDVYEYFGHDPEAVPLLSEGLHNRVATIVDFLRDEGASTPGKLLTQLRKIESNHGTPPMGLSRIDHLYTIVRILAQKKDLDLKLNAYRNR